ncbi:hypothetical protein DCE93_04645 [Agromyces badenianii]|uniref:Uncharacterized protein n=1 Tax=Agromyces badenianii TaxID=2080742 RepID=A0A2S0WUM3_9MICO|nr:hypothetical protein [Agromyces badenianii]AWB95033.1 hypothetical protein DCE93_04645 [Agromyces badenianii]
MHAGNESPAPAGPAEARADGPASRRRDSPGRASAIGGSITRHPLLWGSAWAALLGAVIVLAAFLDWPTWAWALLLVLLVAPSLVATIVVLRATPRDHLAHRESVFGHFFARYLTLVLAFVAWSGSVVLGAAISTSIQLAADGKEDELTGIGFEVLAALTPVAAGVLWAALIVRCSWFLARLRGWGGVPAATEVPVSLLEGRPRLRRIVIGLAHPGLLLATGLASVLLAMLAAEVEFGLVV